MVEGNISNIICFHLTLTVGYVPEGSYSHGCRKGLYDFRILDVLFNSYVISSIFRQLRGSRFVCKRFNNAFLGLLYKYGYDGGRTKVV